MIVQYLRDNIRNPYGVVIAMPRPDGKVAIGFSMVKPKSGDKFDIEMGLNIAKGRALGPQNRISRNGLFAKLKKKNPEAYGLIYNVYNRAVAYYKDIEVIAP